MDEQSPSTADNVGAIAVVVADDFEDSEFTHPRDALVEAGYRLDVIGSDNGQVTGKNGTTVVIDRRAADADPSSYRALLIPGGYSPDRLRTDGDVVALVRELMNREVPVAAICHAPSLLIEADAVEGRRLTGFASIRTDLVNAGAGVLDEEVVVDGNLITSRNPDDLPAFTDALLNALRSQAGTTRGLAARPDVNH